MQEIIRNINLKTLFSYPLSDKEKNYLKAINFLNDSFLNLKIYVSKKYPGWIFYGKSKNLILYEYSKVNDSFYISEEYILNKLSNMIETEDYTYIIRKFILCPLKISTKNIRHISLFQDNDSMMILI